MKFKVGDIVEIIDKDAFYYGAIGDIDEIDLEDEYSYHVIFTMIDDYTGEERVYEDCPYKESQLKLYEGE